jgi:hypothetical protein
MPRAGAGGAGGTASAAPGGRGASATIVCEMTHHRHGHFLVVWRAALEVRPLKRRLHVEDEIVRGLRLELAARSELRWVWFAHRRWQRRHWNAALLII